MKKFFAVVICAVMIVSATACTGSNKGDNVESSAEIVNSTVSNDESSQAESNKDDSKMFASIQEYLEYPNTKKSIETMKSTLSTTLYDFDCYADGDALGSQLALYHWCRSASKNCVVLNFDPLPEQISWLRGAETCQNELL